MKGINQSSDTDQPVIVRGIHPRRPVDCDGESNCKRFVNLDYDYTFRRVSSQFVLGVAQPKLYKNANIKFCTSASLLFYNNQKMKLKGLINVKSQCNTLYNKRSV